MVDSTDHMGVVVVFNAANQEQSFTSTALAGLGLRLHPVQRNSSDPVVRTATFDTKTGTVIVPGLTAAVFVNPE
jgi:pullulanase